jgi:hypothetical protein
VWARLVVAPWWVLWLVNASVFAFGIIAICVLGIPGFVATGWVWPLVSVVGFSLIATAMVTIAQRPIQQSYAPAVAGLSQLQRSQAAKALRHGEVPSDPPVLAAAVRVGNLSMAYQRRVPHWQRVFRWCVPVLWIVAGVLGFVGDNTRSGLTWIGLAVLMAILFAWTSHKARRLWQRLELLRSAADSSPQALSVLAEAKDSAAPPPRLGLRVAFTVVVVIGVAAGVAVMYLRDRRTPDCRTADSVVDFIHGHPDILDSTLITPGGPSLDKYQDWTNQLQAYSRQASSPDLAAHVHRIAEFSAEAVSLVADTRRNPAATRTADEVINRESAYRTIIGQLIGEDKALIPICQSRRSSGVGAPNSWPDRIVFAVSSRAVPA